MHADSYTFYKYQCLLITNASVCLPVFACMYVFLVLWNTTVFYFCVVKTFMCLK